MPYSRKAKYIHHRQQPPDRFVKGTIKTVSVEHATTPTGRNFRKTFPIGTKAVVGQVKNPKKRTAQESNPIYFSAQEKTTVRI